MLIDDTSSCGLELGETLERGARCAAAIFTFAPWTGKEVDFLLQSRVRVRSVGIEVKAASSRAGGMISKGLRALAELLGDRFVRGVVFYTGDTQLPFGPRLNAVPIAALWSQ